MPESYSARTLTVTWTIRKFSTKFERIELTNAFGSQFKVPADWYLYLFPNGYKIGEDDFVGKVILYNKAELSDVNLHMRFSILDDRLNRVTSLTFEEDLYMNGNGDWVHIFGARDFILDPKNSILYNDRLILMAEVSNEAFHAVHTFCTKAELRGMDNRLREFDDYEELLGNEELFTDVTFTVEDRKLPAHKSILAARSSVFRAMFLSEMREAATNVVVIEDVKYRVMRELLRFMYCGRANDVDSLAYDLLAAANKYDVQGLKVLCEESLRRSLVNENAIDYLHLADTHQAPGLKAQVIEYIVRNSTEIVKLPNFNWLANNLHSSLLVELLGAAFQKKK